MAATSAAVPGPRYHPRTILRQTLTVRLGLRLRFKSYGLVSVFRLRRRGWLGRGRRRRCRGRRRGRLWRRWLGRFGLRLGPLPLWISETVPYHPDYAAPCYWDAVLRFRASAEWPASHASRSSDKVIGGYFGVLLSDVAEVTGYHTRVCVLQERAICTCNSRKGGHGGRPHCWQTDRDSVAVAVALLGNVWAACVQSVNLQPYLYRMYELRGKVERTHHRRSGRCH